MMKQDEELWMKKMREVLKDYSESPDPGGWSRFEQGLNPVTEKRIHPYIKQWIAVVAVALIAISGVSLFFMQTPAADEIRYAQTPLLEVIPDVIPERYTPELLQPQSTSTQVASVTSTPLNNLVVNERVIEEEAAEQLLELFLEEDHVEKTKTVIEYPKEEEPEASDSQKSTERQIIRPSGKDKLHLPVTTKDTRSSKNKWALSASVTNASGATTPQNHEFLIMADYLQQMDGMGSGMITVDSDSELFFEGGVPYLKQSATISEIKHKQPISFGLSVRKALRNGFSIETGVTYTFLSSEGVLTNDPSRKVDQKFHYLGIPVRANWDFVDSRHFTLYMSGGGMVERCVYGSVDSEKYTVNRLQFSLTGGVGAQLNVSKRVGIYIEPGVSYFFDDGSDVETIRKETPFNFNLQTGIRFKY